MRLSSFIHRHHPRAFSPQPFVALLLAFSGFLHLSTLPTAAGPSLCLNEIVTLNDTGLQDEDGDHPDWIELYNGSTNALSLAGYGLSDNPNQPFKWVFPPREIAKNSYQLIFASGKNRTNGLNLHANFTLRASGERLVLTRPDGVIVDDWSAVFVPRDFSYGRQPDGDNTRVFFQTPSPRAANRTLGYPTFAPPPQFTHAGGFYPAPFDLASVQNDPQTHLYFTLDGSEPTTNSPQFPATLTIRDRSADPNLLSLIAGTATVNQHTDGWFPPAGIVNKGTVVRARAFRDGAWPSSIVTESFFVFSNALSRYSLPVVSLAVNTNYLFNYTTGIYVLGKIFTDYTNAHPTEPLTGHTPANYTQRGEFWAREAHLQYWEPGGQTGFAQNVKIDIQGQSSRSFREKSLGVKARSDVPPLDTLAYPLWPGLVARNGESLVEFSNARLRNSGNDWNETLFRDALCHRLCAPSGIDTLAYRPLVLFLDGEYWGIHNAREQLDSGYFLNHYGVPPDDFVMCEGPGSLVEGRSGDEELYAQLSRFVETNDLANPTNYAWVSRQMDLTNFIAYQASEIYVANADWPHNNIRYWRRRTANANLAAPLGHDGRWRWAMFDTDLAYGHSWSGGYGENSLAIALSPTGRPGINAPWSTLFFRKLMANPEFRRRFINTYADLLNSAFKESLAESTVLQMQAAIAPAMAEHLARWRTMGTSLTTWSNNVRILRTFATQRPINCRQHVVTELGLAGFANLTLNVAPIGRGRIRVNTLVLDAQTPGVTNGVAYPWKGTYFRGIPIELEALPASGYVFVGWSNRLDLGRQTRIPVTLSNNLTLIALFQPTEPHDLKMGPYRFSAWNATSPAGTYPPSMSFQQTSQSDPDLAAPLNDAWILPYNLTNRSRLNGLNEEGLGFLNTSSAQELPGAGFVGAAVVALRTVGIPSWEVSWIGGTLAPNEQPYALRLQSAVGDETFQDVLDSNGHAVEYLREPSAGQSRLIGPIALPAATTNQAYVRLRWKYYHVAGTSGPRSQLRLDDIWITAHPAPEPGHWKVTPFSMIQPVDLEFVGAPRQPYQIESTTNWLRWDLEWAGISDLQGALPWRLRWPPAETFRFFRTRTPIP